jgi:HK97 family phage portal protein
MGLLDNIRDGLANWAVKAAGLPVMSATGGRFNAPDRRGFEQQAKAYLNQVVLACIATRAQTMNEPPLTAVDPVSKEVIAQHPLTRLFRKPNKDMSQSMFWQYVSTYVDIGGNAYIHKVRNVYGQVIEMRPYHSGHIVPVSESGQWVDYYQYQYEGVTKELDPRDIIHIRSYYIDPLNPILGISPIRAAGINIDTYNELMQTLYSYLRNNGVPSGVLSVQQTINQQQAESLKEQFQSNTTGRNRGKPIVLPSGMSYTQMGLDVSRMEASAQFAQYETAICGIYRVHPAVAMTMAGLQSSTYSNMQTAFQEYTLLTRVPTWNTWEEQVELSFSNEYPEVDVEFDTSNVAALQSDPDAVIYPVIAQFNANLITVDEARQRMGYTPASEGGDNYAYSLVQPAPAFGALSAKDAARALGKAEPGRMLPLATVAASYMSDAKWQPVELPQSGWIDQSVDVKAEAFWRAMDKTIANYSKSLEGDTSKLIEGVGKVLTKKATKGAAGAEVKDTDPQLQLLIQQYMKATGAWRKQLLDEIMKLAVTEVGADLASVQTYVDKLLAKVTTDMSSKITASVGNIQQEVQAKVASMPGASAEDIEKELTSTFETLSKSRAQAIAQTQARAASSQVATATWSAVNAEETDPDEEIVKVWTTRRDDKVRESHRKLDGMWVTMGGTFEGGLQSPGIGKEPGDVVRCRCVLRPVRRKNLGRQAR